MRASTLFAITVSLLLGLGAVAAARYAGLFSNKPDAAPAAANKEPAIRALVAHTNIFQDLTVTPDLVTIDEIPSDDPRYARLKQNADKLLPPRIGAVAMRVAARNILAGEVLTKSDLLELALPPKISERLAPGMRSVNVVVPKDRAAGGVIRTGEYVDVLLTSDINYKGERVSDTLKTNCIARGCKVVMKRNMIFNAMMADPEDKPVHLTLELNPYRAALVEFALNRGTISLLPTEKPAALAGTFSDLSSKEYADEQTRVEAAVRGEYTVTTQDLVRIFNLVPPPPPPVVPPPSVTRNIVGTEFVQSKVFTAGGQPLGMAAPGATAASLTPAPGAPATGAAATATAAASGEGGFTFSVPNALDPKGCATCGKK